MLNANLNKYHTQIFFFLSLIFYFLNFDLNDKYISIICFFLISTIGVSHGALDNLKGIRLLKKFKIKNNFLLLFELHCHCFCRCSALVNITNDYFTTFSYSSFFSFW